MFSKIVCALFLLSSFSSFAVTTAVTCSDSAADQLAADLLRVADRVSCPSNEGIKSICGFVDSRVTEPEGSPDYYSYQRKIYALACVNSSDGPEAIQRKVQTFWNQYSNDLTCDSLSFNVSNGSILKLAVSRKFDDFINEAVTDWKVGLNKIDSADQKTVLDYIQDELSKVRGTPLESKLRHYYETFRNAGAKHKREL